jgi:hypothetical protein
LQAGITNIIAANKTASSWLRCSFCEVISELMSLVVGIFPWQIWMI